MPFVLCIDSFSCHKHTNRRIFYSLCSFPFVHAEFLFASLMLLSAFVLEAVCICELLVVCNMCGTVCAYGVFLNLNIRFSWLSCHGLYFDFFRKLWTNNSNSFKSTFHQMWQFVLRNRMTSALIMTVMFIFPHSFSLMNDFHFGIKR